MIGGQRPTSGDPRGCTAPGVRGSAMFVVMEVVVVVVVVEVAVVAGRLWWARCSWQWSPQVARKCKFAAADAGIKAWFGLRWARSWQVWWWLRLVAVLRTGGL